MASVGKEEVEYESDPEEAKLSLTMRRREASDDEEEEEEDGEERENPTKRIDSRAGIVSDGDSDAQGAAAEYDDDDDKESEIDEEEEEEEYEEGGAEEGVSGGGVVVAAEAVEVVAELAAEADERHGERGRSVEGSTEEVEEDGVNQVGGEEKKENEPFAVPTAGAFYMHDDRFRDNSGARNRRTLGGRKLWESKDDRKWGHDKFEEMTSQERHYEEGRRNSRGPHRGRGKNRGADREIQRGNRSKAYKNDNQNHAPKTVRGRGPRRYEPTFRNSNEAPPTQNKKYGKFVEKTSHGSSGRAPGPTSNNEPNRVATGKHVFASSLSSASPPFYPSASSNKEITQTQKRDVQAGPANRNFRPATVDENFSMSQSNSMLRGKEIAGTVPPVAGKSSNYQLPPPGSSLINSPQFSQSRVQGRGPAPSGKMNFQSKSSHNQVNRVSPPTQMNSVQQNPVQSKVQSQPILQASAQQVGQSPGSGSQASSPSKAALSINSFESGELESPFESSKSKTALVAKVRGIVQGNGRGTFPYAGAQVMAVSGSMGGSDHNFPPTPAFLPVMSFGNQNPGGIGVPALGMAFPGYVGQPQLGMGNSEMTWLPVLAGAAGGLGASYCPPFITVDGAYHARPSGQASSASASSKEINTDNPSNEWKPPQRLELTSDEFGQRQNNARRYSKMNFGQ